LKFGSIVEKLLNVEKCPLRHYGHKNNVKNGAKGIFQPSITFELLNQISKIELFWNLPN